nr:MAG TPA: hypothetical protein [Caudoviricetes sp.]
MATYYENSPKQGKSLTLVLFKDNPVLSLLIFSYFIICSNGGKYGNLERY